MVIDASLRSCSISADAQFQPGWWLLFDVSFFKAFAANEQPVDGAVDVFKTR